MLQKGSGFDPVFETLHLSVGSDSFLIPVH